MRIRVTIAVGTALLAALVPPVSGMAAAPSPAGETTTVLTLVALGDSLPGGMGCVEPCRPYPELVGQAAAKALGVPVTIRVLATNDGLGSGTLLERVTTDQAHRDEIASADIITLQVGRNDWFDGCYAPNLEPCLTAGEARVAANLDGILTVIDELRAGRPTAVRVLDYYNAETGDPNLPADWQFEDTPEATAAFMAAYDPLLRRLDDTICRVATEHGARCVDLMAAFNGPDGTASADALLQHPDHVHPNADGAALIARIVAETGFAPLMATPTGGASSVAPPVGRIVFSRWDDAVGDFQVFTVSADGKGEALVLPGAHEIPHWSPDGASLVTTAVTAAGQVVPAIVGADGTAYRELPVDAGLNLGCAGWTPDGERLLCEGWSDADPTLDGIRTISAADGGDITRLTQIHDVPGGISPDGSTIVFVRPTEGTDAGSLWLMDADGSHQRQLGDVSVGLQVRFSPDGASILADDTQGHLFTVSTADGSATPIAIPGAGAYEATWSPDGAWIAFAMFSGPGTAPDLYAMRLDGTGLIQLTDTPGVVDEAPDWSPG